MDSVRFGRALGVGARAAAKSLVSAANAAAAPNPAKPSPGTPPRQPTAAAPSARPSMADVSQRVTQVASQVQQASEGINRGSQQLKQSVMSPVKRLSGVLWLEFTGVFFGLFAMSAGTAAWKLRSALHDTPATHEDHTRLLLAIAICAVFGYFCVSSFVRAKRRERAK